MKRICTDASCTKTGDIEFRGVDMDTMEELFHRGPYKNASSNIGEALGVVLGLAWLKQQKHPEYILYTDSAVAMYWIKNKKFNTSLERRTDNREVFELIYKAEAFLETCSLEEIMSVQKWRTDLWGENFADFQRKGNGKGPRSEVPGRETKPKSKSRKKKQ